jgi:hypothetical protein
MLKAALVTIALSLVVARPAAAQSKSWAAVKGSVTPQAAFVFGINADPIRATATYATALKMFLDDETDAKQAFDLIKATCAIDVPSAISDVTAIMKADEKPLVVLGLNGLDEATVVACLEKVGNQLAGNTGATLKMTAKKKGKITEYSVPGESEKLYIAWLAKDVLAFTDNPNDKNQITKMLAGKAAKGNLGKWLAKVSTTAPVWFAVSMKKDDPDMGTVLGGYGQVDISNGTIVGNGHIVLTKPADATKAAAQGNTELASAKTEAGSKLPAAKRVLDTVSIVANGNLIDVSGSVADKDIAALIPQLDKLF